MSYLVLARKWRPQLFADLLGQETIVRIIQNAIKLNRVPHAMLFTGTRGVGKTSSARIVAKALNCESDASIEPCNICTNCKEISQSQNIDVLEVDGASNTSVEDVRELKEQVQYRPAKSKYKIFIIDEVHMLSNSAFNALLKTLEEPPDHIKFIFATTEAHKVPNTIHSRCQRFDFKEVSQEKLKGHLDIILEKEKVKVEETGLDLLVKQANGSVRDALSLLDQVIALSNIDNQFVSEQEIVDVLGLAHRTLIYDAIESMLDFDHLKALNLIDKVYQSGIDLKHFIKELLEKIRDLRVIQFENTEHLIQANNDDRIRLKQYAENVASEQLDRLYDIFKDCLFDVSRSSFARSILEIAFLKACQKVPALNIEKLMQQIESKQNVYTKIEVKHSKIADNDLSKDDSSAEEVISTQSANKVLKPDNKPDLHSPKAVLKNIQEKPLSVSSNQVAPKPSHDHSKSLSNDVSTNNISDWDKLLQYAKVNKPSYAAILLQVNEHTLGDGVLRMTFEQNSFYSERAKEDSFLSFIKTSVKDALGLDVMVKLEEQSSKDTAKTKPQSMDAKKQIILNDEKVQQTLSLFDASIEDIHFHQ